MKKVKMTTKRIIVLESFVIIGSFDCDRTHGAMKEQEHAQEIKNGNVNKHELKPKVIAENNRHQKVKQVCERIGIKKWNKMSKGV